MLWAGLLAWLLQYPVQWTDPFVYVLVLVQMHLYTGLFITAHDAMHGVVSANARLNHGLGGLCALLFSYNYYPQLYRKHHQHHAHVVSDRDPDYHPSDRFVPWYLSFVRQYVTIWQILAMAVTYHVLKIWFPRENLILFWMVPAILSTLQLFYFGTFLPHRGEHAPDDPHRSKGQATHHLRAFVTCYFFGYHHEHHAYPYLPWWRLAAARDRVEGRTSAPTA